MSDMSHLESRLSSLKEAVASLREFHKRAFMPAPPMPQGPIPQDPMMQGGAPPMDPSMMQGGGMPMDPSMMQGGGAPPMDPAMMQGGAPPMDPSMMQGGGAPPPPPISPDTVDQIISLMEEMGQKLAMVQEDVEKIKQEIGGALDDLGQQVMELDKRLAEVAASSSAAPAVPTSPGPGGGMPMM